MWCRPAAKSESVSTCIVYGLSSSDTLAGALMATEHAASEYSVTVPPVSATSTDTAGVASLPTYVPSDMAPAVTTLRAEGGAGPPAASAASRPATEPRHNATAATHSMMSVPDMSFIIYIICHAPINVQWQPFPAE